MDDLKRYKETHGHANVSIPEDKSLAQFCANARYQFTLPFEPRFYGRSRALKTGQFFFEPTPHHDGPPFDPMPTSDADPQTSATASHPGDVTRVAARSDSADGGSAVTIFGIVAICYKWGDAKSPR
jgi:hypothetical protein